MTINEYLDLVKAALKSLPELAKVGVVVDHQQGADRLMDKALQKSKGYCVIIGEVSNRLASKDAEGAKVRLKFGVSVYSPQVIKNDGVTGASLRDAILRKLHNARLLPNKHHYHETHYVDGKVFLEKEGNRARMIHAMAYEVNLNY